VTRTDAAVAVVGAGIVGSCIALELARRGLDVVLLDRGGPGEGCSFGNSGAVSAGSVAPLAMPGIVSTLPGMLSDPLGPLHLPLSYLPRALPWLLAFLASARPHRVERSVARLADLHQDALRLHRELAQEAGVPELLLERGHLHLYPDAAAFGKDAAGWRLRAQHGYPYEELDRDGILALEPAIGSRYRVGACLRSGHGTILNPHRYTSAIAAAAQRQGAAFQRAEVSGLHSEGRGWRIDTAGPPLRARHVVLAAGAWTPRLLRPLGVQLRLESQRGYHVQFRGPAPVSRTVVLADRKVFLTPMEEGLRAGGTVEFGGLERPPTPQRSSMLVRIAQEAFDGRDLGACSEWMGHRPCMPDSVPVVGPAAGLPGLWLATGHGHLGLTDAPRTALLIAEGLAVAER